MLIFDNKGNSSFLDLVQKCIRANIIFSGIRILKKRDLTKVYELYNPKKFQLEIAIAKYMQNNNKKVYWVDAIGKNPVKMIKGNGIKDWKDQFEMDKEIYFKFMPFLKVLKLSFIFCRKKYR